MLTITGCKTIPENEIILPPYPKRLEQEYPQTTEDYVRLIIYYEFLVEEWEIWGNTVTELLNSEEQNETFRK